MAENPFPSSSEDAIKIDGNDSDWSGIKAFKDPFCGTKQKDTVDVKTLHAVFTKTHFIYKFVLDPEPSKFSAKNDLSILQVVYDVDNNKSTGATSKQLFYKHKATGFERRIEVVINKNKEVTAKVYSSDNNFGKVLKTWKSGSENFSVKGNVVEMKVPYELINFKPQSGLNKLRMYFAEFANSTGNSGYEPLSLTLDYSSLNKVESKEDSSSKSSDGGGGSKIYLLMLATIWLVSILCGFAIAPKAGLSNGVAAINFIPFIGQLAFLFILAFGQWPLHKDYQKLEDRLREFDDVI